MKTDERAFLSAVQAEAVRPIGERKSPREIAAEMGMHWKRAAYLCQKWTDKGWYNYGVSVDLGWLWPEALSI